MSDNGKGLHVAALEIQNFLSIREAQLAPGKVARIEGKNGQGKTACLKAVIAAFKGAGAEVINLEADRAQVLVKLSDDTTIQRSFIRDSKRQPPRITTGDGMRPASPQAYLDRLLGPTIFNPVQFLLLPANERRRYLLQAVPATISAAKIAEATGDLVDDASGHALDVLDRLRAEAYSKRAEANHDLRQAKAHHKIVAAHVGPEPDGMEESLTAVEREMAEKGPKLARAEAALEYEAENDERRQRLQAKAGEIERDLEEAVAYGEDELQAQEAVVNDLRRRLEEAEARMEAMEDVNRAVADKMDALAEARRELDELPEPKVTTAQVDEMRRYSAQLERRIETARQWSRWRTAKNAA
ncbi:MAG: AAA family ATPase, partial [Proteobacteria bacterium]|nr:AAA family ATPase [Pseudomonadota bacterium]